MKSLAFRRSKVYICHYATYTLGAHTKSDLKVHLIWIPKYRKRVLTAQVAIRARDILRQIAVEHELAIITVK
ncbi:MAG: transposase, partial [Chlorobi bacterium]|nr:transposase [Chlorobiota bacterium]